MLPYTEGRVCKSIPLVLRKAPQMLPISYTGGVFRSEVSKYQVLPDTSTL